MRWPRLFPSTPFTAMPAPPGSAWCQHCQAWKVYDVIPAVAAHDIPAMVICTFCGLWIAEYDLEETA